MNLSAMSYPLVSIIINNYNYGRFLGQAIDSALEQNYPNFEVIVVDDGSTDNSIEIIKSYGDKIVSILKPNGGHASTFNAGFAASRGETLCFLDSDDLFLPNKIAKVVDVFLSGKDIHWCFHPLSYKETSELDLEHSLENDKTPPTKNEIDFRIDIKNGRLPDFVPQTSAIAFSRDLLQQIFPMPEDERTYVGDTYISMVAISLRKGCVLNQFLSIYRLHGSNAYTNPNLEARRSTFASLHIVTGYWLRTNFPHIKEYTDIFFAKGLSCFWLIAEPEDRFKKIIKDYFSYLSLTEKIKVVLRSLVYCQKSFWSKDLP